MKCLNIKQRGAIIRSRVQWYNDGEKNTKYFLNLEKRHLKQKTIKCLHLSDNEVVNTDEEILKEAKSFYQKLYSSTVSSTDNQCGEIFFPLGNIETLTEREQNECGCLLTEAECWESLKSMQLPRSYVNHTNVFFSFLSRVIFSLVPSYVSLNFSRFSTIIPQGKVWGYFYQTKFWEKDLSFCFRGKFSINLLWTLCRVKTFKRSAAE